MPEVVSHTTRQIRVGKRLLPASSRRPPSARASTGVTTARAGSAQPRQARRVYCRNSQAHAIHDNRRHGDAGYGGSASRCDAAPAGVPSRQEEMASGPGPHGPSHPGKERGPCGPALVSLPARNNWRIAGGRTRTQAAQEAHSLCRSDSHMDFAPVSHRVSFYIRGYGRHVVVEDTIDYKQLALAESTPGQRKDLCGFNGGRAKPSQRQGPGRAVLDQRQTQ
ncbi:hypothetical protein NDU88_003159 [Pleurodeles waltl]|uniref:Uncharacterized protein n=1 Tax=Pleurodeles waltl TaxID=8319 RepID=A0AAV7UFC3_PLEWA|nr:hypothetical protein NDU88_003159 [Pleurodeles waltl]